MLIPIFIDTKDLSAEFSMSKDQVNQMVDNAVKSLTLEAYNLWSEQAKRNLKSTRNRYLQNLIIVEAGFMKGEIVLRMDDPLVAMLENGASPFDMKENFEKSSKKKPTKSGGWMLTIPLRYGTPDAIGESEVFSGILPNEVYQKIKPLETNIQTGSGMRSRGLQLNEIPSQYQEPKTRARIPETPTSKAFEEYKNKTSLYEGVVKMKDTSTGQTSGYMSFRRVSDKSDPLAWIHPGMEERNFADKAIEELDVPNIVDIAVDNYLANM